MNLHRVNHMIIRSDQPNPEAWPLLATFVDAVICLRQNGETGDFYAARECDTVEKAGLTFVNVPVGELIWDAPTVEQIERAMKLMKDGRRWLIHCRRGKDRTGVFVACYRMLCCGWTKEAAIKEANGIGMSRLQVKMHEFLEHFNPGVVVQGEAPGNKA
jgi:protein tyrosine/serine phosphatase